MKKCLIKWYKFSNEAIVPTKKERAAGFDIYTTETFVRIPAHSQHMFKTGLGAVVSEGYWLMAFDRGSTGSRGMHVHCGVIDNDYTGEIFICIKNDNNYPVVITNSVDKAFFDSALNELYYPASKAIAQIIPIAMPEVACCPCGEAEWMKAVEESERGAGKLGSSGK